MEKVAVGVGLGGFVAKKMGVADAVVTTGAL
jgi:hypothetical protein